MENQRNKNESFREFLNRNTNLLTLSSIFNALAIYSSSIPGIVDFAIALNLMFIILSCAVVLPIYFDDNDSDLPQHKIFLFKLAVLLCQGCMTGLILGHYHKVANSIVFPAIIFIVTFFTLGHIAADKFADLLVKKYKVKTQSRMNVFMGFYTVLLLLFSLLTAYFARYLLLL